MNNEELVLIPNDERRVNEIEMKLKKMLAFNSVEQFITFYNSGFINSSHTEVRDIVKEIEESYKNIETINRKIVIINENEVILKGIQLLMEQAMVAVQLKRLAGVLLDEGYSADDHIYFTEQEEGKPMLGDVEEGLSSHWMFNKKLAQSHGEILGNVFLRSSLRLVNGEDKVDVIAFSIIDISQLNTDFIKEVQDFIRDKVSK